MAEREDSPPVSQNARVSAGLLILFLGRVYPTRVSLATDLSASEALALSFGGIGGRWVRVPTRGRMRNRYRTRKSKQTRKPMPVTPHQTPVDWDYRSGHVVGQVGRQKFDHLGAILHGTEPPKGDQFGPLTLALDAAGNNRRPVAITPGAMQIAVIANGPRSCARYRV